MVVGGALPAEVQIERQAVRVVRADAERAAKADPAFYDEQVRFVHRTRTLAQISGSHGVEPRVKAAWREMYGTELSHGRYDYLAHHPDHAPTRNACVREVLQGGFLALIEEDPRVSFVSAIALAQRYIDELLSDKQRCVKGSSTSRMRDEAGEWKDILVVHQEPPQQALASAFEHLSDIHKVYGSLLKIAQSVGLAPGQVQGQASQQHVNVNVMQAGAVPKATSLVVTDEDEVGPKVSPEQAARLMAQENRPFFEPPDSSMEYSEHVKLSRMQDILAGLQAKQILEAKRLDQPSSPPTEDPEQVREANMFEGVIEDPKAVLEAEAADRELPKSRRLDP